MKIKLLDYKVVDLSFQASEDAMTMEVAKNDLSLEVGQFILMMRIKSLGLDSRWHLAKKDIQYVLRCVFSLKQIL